MTALSVEIMAPDTDKTIRVCREVISTLAMRPGAVHSKKKSTSEHLFWCFRLSQIEDSIEYLEGPNTTWKDYDRNVG